MSSFGLSVAAVPPVQWQYRIPRMLVDKHGRALEDLRISVTDRCNFRCTYCMPLDQYDWISRDQILSYEEIGRLARVFAGLGVRKLRITGGEPLLRADLEDLVEMLARVDGIEDICLTTNASLLADKAEPLKRGRLASAYGEPRLARPNDLRTHGTARRLGGCAGGHLCCHRDRSSPGQAQCGD